LSQTILYADGSLFHYLFVQRPVASVFLSAAIIWSLYMFIGPWIRRRLKQQPA